MIRMTWLPLILLLAGCGVSHIQTLREAQMAFSQAADVENRQRLGDTAALADATAAATNYRLAAKMLDDLIATKRAELQQDDLLCTAMTIQAMSLWRLGDHEKAMTIATTAQDQCTPAAGAPSSTPRDRALLRAIPGLVRIDQAKAKADNTTPGEFDSVQKLIQDAQRDLSAARAIVPPNHPVQAYLLLSQLAGIRVWQEAILKEKLTGETQANARKAVEDMAQCRLRQYKCFLQGDLNWRNDPTLEGWRTLLSVPTQPVLNETCAETVRCTP